jgi:serine/threonine protein kinase
VTPQIVVVAVWTPDPLLPLLTQGRKVGKGRYTLVRTLGAGGMGIVWLAFDEQLKEFVALKFLPPEVRDDPGALDDLRLETLKSRQLSHPHIVRIHDMHQFEDEPPFISMEYVDGLTLQELRLRQPQRLLTWPQLAPLLEQLCQALDYAHRESVVHRDLKPSNLMIDHLGRLKLADFGIAAALSDASTETTLSPIRGTLLYMSPQQLQGHRVRVTDDIYALGALVYDLLTSKPPFYTGDLARQLLMATPMTMADRLAELDLKAEIPDRVSAVVMSCLEKEPSRRPQSARALAKAIGRPSTDPRLTTIEGIPTSRRSRSPGRWLQNWWNGIVGRAK